MKSYKFSEVKLSINFTYSTELAVTLLQCLLGTVILLERCNIAAVLLEYMILYARYVFTKFSNHTERILFFQL